MSPLAGLVVFLVAAAILLWQREELENA